MLAWDRVVTLHRPVLIKSIHYALTGFNLPADVPLQLRLGKRPAQDLPFRLVGNDTDTVAIAKDQIARPDPHLVDCDRTAKIHDIVAALQTVGVTTVGEGGKVQGQYAVAIAQMRIEHHPRRTQVLRPHHQHVPQPRYMRGPAAGDIDLVGTKRLDGFEQQTERLRIKARWLPVFNRWFILYRHGTPDQHHVAS